MDYKEKVIALLNSQELSKEQKEKLESIFPELKESEDERIRKIAIEFVRQNNSFEYLLGVSRNEVIAWLEKQGENPTTLPKWKYKKDNAPLLRDSIILNKYGCVAKSPSGAIVSDVWVIDYDELAKLPKEESEKQGEQKSADKVEPKFHEGDWIIRNNEYTGVPIQVIEFKGYYRCNLNGEIVTLTLNDVHNNFHLWTIQDAKDGDVLFTSSTASHETFIFKSIDEKGNVKCYFAYDSEDGFQEGIYNFIGRATNCKPATKEQRDLLFQKMKDAGYEWDAEKKEFRKIEQNPAWSEEDESKIRHLIAFLDTNPNSVIYSRPKEEWIDWLKSIKDRVQPKQEWSEENEIMIKVLDSIIRYIVEIVDKDALKKFGTNREELFYWLKSLRPQNRWKPSDEQMEYLAKAITTLGNEGDNKTSAILYELRTNLKKLKG